MKPWARQFEASYDRVDRVFRSRLLSADKIANPTAEVEERWVTDLMRMDSPCRRGRRILGARRQSILAGHTEKPPIEGWAARSNGSMIGLG
jgi:hypothetical protein